jgi:hypothetical protein
VQHSFDNFADVDQNCKNYRACTALRLRALQLSERDENFVWDKRAPLSDST